MRNTTYGMLLILLVMGTLTLASTILQVKCLETAETEWDRTYGGYHDDCSYSMVHTSDGGYALAGYTKSSGAGSADFWLVKTDSTGEMEWNKTYGGTGWDEAWSMVQADDGGYAVAGWTYSFGYGNSDIWLVKTDSDGNMEWNQTYGGGNYEGPWMEIIQAVDGGYAIVSRTNSSGAGLDDFWLVKTDVYGNHMWNQTYGGAGNERAYSIIQTSDGGYALTGITSSFGAGSQDFWLVKTDASGIEQWNQTYGGMHNDFAFSVIQTSDGGYAIAGETYSFGSGASDFWLVKTDASGIEQWNQTYGGINHEGANSVVQTANRGFMLVGYTETFGSGPRDLWLVNINVAGDMGWNQTYGGASREIGYSVVPTDDDGYALVGRTLSYGAGGYDFWLIKLKPETPPIAWECIFIDSCRNTELRISTDDKHFQFVAPDKEYPIKYDPDMQIYQRRCFTSIKICYIDDEIELSATAIHDRFDFCIAYAKDKQTCRRYLLIDDWRKYCSDMRIRIRWRRCSTSINIRYKDNEVKLSAKAKFGRLNFYKVCTKDKNTGRRYVLIDTWRRQRNCFFNKNKP